VSRKPIRLWSDSVVVFAWPSCWSKASPNYYEHDVIELFSKNPHTMPVTIQRIDDSTYVLRLSGMVQRTEFDNVQDPVAGDVERGVHPRILAVLENFEGWGQGLEWGNLDFRYWHSNEIEKIAIVGEPRWEQQALAFAGMGFRNAPVKFFPDTRLAEARTWLAA
jgi:hypothetical protein